MATVDQLRILCQDPEGASELLDNESYETILDIESNVFRAASLVAQTIAASLAQKIRVKVGPIAIDLNQKYEHYLELSESFDKKALLLTGGSISSESTVAEPIVSGISESEMESVREDTDRPQSKFRIGLTDNDGSEYDEDD